MLRADVIAIEVPVRVRSSHLIATREFSASRRSYFAAQAAGDDIRWEPRFDSGPIRVLAVELRSIAIDPPSDIGEQRLVVHFARAQDEAAVDRFLSKLAVALSVTISCGQLDATYGVLFVDIPLAEVRRSRLSLEDRVRIAEAVSVECTSPQTLSAEMLGGLTWSPLDEIFVEGMRAPDVKTKLIQWFVVVEELERRDEFSTLFERLFTSEQVAALTASSALTPKQAERLSGCAGGRNLTG